MPFGIGPLELIIVLVIALVIFGPKRLPDLGRSLGSGMREFKDSITASSKSEDDDDEPVAVTAPRSDDPAKPDDAVSRPRG
jgi:sec-independent protein translocase protein TatA